MASDFFDSNIVIYLTSGETAKATRARELLETGGIISAQVLNEATSVLRSKSKLDWLSIRQILDAVRDGCTVEPVTAATHDLALQIAERFHVHIYDASIIAAAKLAGCATIWSEDMQDGQEIEGVTIRNPF